MSGHDAVLKRVLSADFGLDVMVRGVIGADRRSERRPAELRRIPAAAPAQRCPGPVPAAPRHGAAGRPDDVPPDEPR